MSVLVTGYVLVDEFCGYGLMRRLQDILDGVEANLQVMKTHIKAH